MRSGRKRSRTNGLVAALLLGGAILGGAILLASTAARAATLEAASCDDSDVQAAIDGAAEGDTVAVPAGRCTWRTTVRLEAIGLTLQGAGIDRTTIVDDTGDGWDESAIFIQGAAGSPFRITGFTFTGRSDSHGVIQIRGDAEGWRIDNCRFLELTHRCIAVNGRAVGLVDHCAFLDGGQPIAVTEYDAEAAWARPLSLGTADAVYLEDCVIRGADGGYAIDANDGGRYVFRYNDVFYALPGSHGRCNTSGRGLFSYEIYENTITDDTTWWCGAHIRGGTGVIFNNRWVGPHYRESPVCVVNYRTCEGDGHEDCSPHGWDRCDGDSPHDGNEDPTGYPCADQIGRSTGQSLEPLYGWGNTLNGAQVPAIGVLEPWDGCDAPSMPDHIQEGRDFFNDTPRPGYTPLVYPHPQNDSAPTCGNRGFFCCDACAEGAAAIPAHDGDCSDTGTGGSAQICCEACVPEPADDNAGCGCRAGHPNDGSSSTPRPMLPLVLPLLLLLGLGLRLKR